MKKITETSFFYLNILYLTCISSIPFPVALTLYKIGSKIICIYCEKNHNIFLIMSKIPVPTCRRLVQLVRMLEKRGSGKITSAEIQSVTGWSSAVVRKDISQIGYKGGVSNGYSVEELRKAICSALDIPDMDEETEHLCCIVGLGKFGAALLENGFLAGTSFRIAAGFDANVNRTEILKASFPLYPASRLESVILENRIEYGILCVSDQTAQAMAERLVKCGIRGIVNYTGEMLKLPENVGVENVSPVLALNNLSVRNMTENGGVK